MYNTPATLTLVTTDVDGEPLSFEVLAEPIHGTLSGTPPLVTYRRGRAEHRPLRVARERGGGGSVRVNVFLMIPT